MVLMYIIPIEPRKESSMPGSLAFPTLGELIIYQRGIENLLKLHNLVLPPPMTGYEEATKIVHVDKSNRKRTTHAWEWYIYTTSKNGED